MERKGTELLSSARFEATLIVRRYSKSSAASQRKITVMIVSQMNPLSDFNLVASRGQFDNKSTFRSRVSPTGELVATTITRRVLSRREIK
jgi:hypothetical protein